MQDGCQKHYHRHLCPVFKCHLQTDLLSTIRNPDMSAFQIPTVFATDGLITETINNPRNIYQSKTRLHSPVFISFHPNSFVGILFVIAQLKPTKSKFFVLQIEPFESIASGKCSTMRVEYTAGNQIWDKSPIWMVKCPVHKWSCFRMLVWKLDKNLHFIVKIV